jgi:hypothetical protein
MDDAQTFERAVDALLASAGLNPAEFRSGGEWVLPFDDGLAVHARQVPGARVVQLYARLGMFEGDDIAQELLRANWRGASRGLAFSSEPATGQVLAVQSLSLASADPAGEVGRFAGLARGWRLALAQAGTSTGQPQPGLSDGGPTGLLKV